MSRSSRQTSKIGNSCAESEKQDKRKANRNYRRKVRISISKGEEFQPMVREVSDVWKFGKDGKTYWWRERGDRIMRK